MNYYVEIHYKKGPTFSSTLTANSAELAKAHTIRHANDCGMREKIKKIITRRLS